MDSFTGNLYQKAIEAFAAAPFQPDQWDEGLKHVGEAAGGWTAQLLGVDKRGAILFNQIPRMPADATIEWEKRGGAIPGVNPRAASLFSPSYSVATDDDLLSRAEQEQSPVYQDLFDKFDARFMLVGTLPQQQDHRRIVGVLRNRRQGHAQGNDVELLTQVMPHVNAALEMQMRLNGHDCAIAIGSFDMLNLAAFLCDPTGRVVAQTRAGEALLAAGDMVRLRQGVLHAATSQQDGPLQNALRRATHRPGELRGDDAPQTVIALTDAKGQACRVDVSPVPAGHFHFSAQATCMVVIAEPRPVADPRTLLAQAYGLTPTEAAVALDLAQGMSATDIALHRGVSTETVRVQVRAVLRKTDVSKATALAAIIGRFNF